MKHLLLFLSFALLFSNAIGQVNNPNEKVRVTFENQQQAEGYLFIMHPKDFFKPLKFKSNKGELILLTDAEVASIELIDLGQKYVSYSTIYKGATGNVPKKVADFYKVIVEGTTSLYYSIDSLNTEYYIMRLGNEFLEFSRHKRTSTNMKGGFYDSGLRATDSLFSKCISEKETFIFSEHALAKKAREYNVCMNSSSYRAPSEKTRLFIGGLIGYTTSAVTFNDSNELTAPYGFASNYQLKGYYDLSELTSETLTQSSFLIGMTFSIFPRWNKHFSIEIQPSFTNRKWSYPSQKLEMESSYIEIPGHLKMNLGLKNSLQPFFGFGITPAIALNSSYTSDPLTIKFNAEPFPGSTNFPKITEVEMPIILPNEYSPSQLRLSVSTGFDYFLGKSKIGLSYRYDFLGSLTKSEIYTTSCSTNNFYLTIAFLSKK
jgi:hypothetical protein